MLPVYKSRKIHACFILTRNPDIVGAMKMCPMYWWDPHQEFTVIATYPSLIIDQRVVGEVDISCIFGISYYFIQDLA